jgi:hypothetical protein
VNATSCPLGSTDAAALATVRGIETRLIQHPISVGGRTVGGGEFFEGLLSGLYSPTDWTQLAQAVALAGHGSGAGILLFSDALLHRQSDGSYSNLIDSNMAIDCIDRPAPRALSTYVAAAKDFATTAPDFGAAIEFGTLPCAYWRVPPVEATHPVHAPGSPTILVIGTTKDPATPYVWAQSLAKQLSKGVLLTFRGDGHTAALRGDSCVDSAVHAYLESLVAPPAGTSCS